MAVTRPVNLQIPFANSGSKNTIPVPSQIGVTAGAASFTDGFPPLTFTPLASGGVQPAGADFNGIFNILSQHTTFLNAGGLYRFDAALATAIGGYPVGFVLQDDAGLNSYVNISAGNTTNFNSSPSSIGVSWIPYAGQAATQSGENIYAVGGGTANAQTATYSPAITALTDGMVLWFKAAAANAGATTLNVNGLGVSPVVNTSLTALTGGEILANSRYGVIWSATLSSWVLLAPTVASQAEVNAGTDDAKFVTSKKLRLGFAISLTPAGYIAFPTWMGGLLFQWNTYDSSTAGSAVTWPIAFPSALLAAVAIPANISVPIAVSLFGGTKTGVTLYSASSTPGCYCFSIGF